MKKSFIFGLAALCALVSCNKETPTLLSEGSEVRFATNLNEYTVKSSLSDSDQIGIFAGAPISRINVLGEVNSEQEIEFASGSEIRWKSHQTATTTFAAYSPYDEQCDAEASDPFKFTFSLTADQTTADGVIASDLLTALAADVAPDSTEPVSLNFIHQCSKMVVNVMKDIDEEIESVEILDTKITGVVDLESQTVSGHSGEAAPIICYRPNSAAYTFEAIILPAENIAPKIKVTVEGDKTYTFSMSGTMSFNAGKQYTASLTIEAPQSAPLAVGAITEREIIGTPFAYEESPW